jgi:phospholipid-binding lipoprotein MlaA
MKSVKAKVMALAVSTLVSTSSFAQPDTEARNPDPWEGFNRGVYTFNDGVDRFFLKPVAQGYQAITPDPVEDGIGNVFSNLFEVRNIINDVLQWKWGQAANDTGRFLVNSTVGIVGLFDVAQHMGMPENDGGEDFGQTLAVWGVGSGPYLVIPFLGPSTLRDGAAMPVDMQMDLVSYIDHVPTRNTTYGVRIVDTRASLLEAEKLMSGDRYTFMRDAYLQRREYVINDGAVEDDFGGDAGEYGDY